MRFDETDELDDVAQQGEPHTMLKAYFDYYAHHPTAARYLYIDFPRHFYFQNKVRALFCCALALSDRCRLGA